MISVNTEMELSNYNLDGKWNDYIAVQKEVIAVLKQKEYFETTDIINQKTGMVIRVTTKGIKETLGAGKRFQALPKILKQKKVAILIYLKQIIEKAELLADNVANIHDENGYMFAYLGAPILIDEEICYVRISIKKKVASNLFWIHNIDERKSSELLDPFNE